MRQNGVHLQNMQNFFGRFAQINFTIRKGCFNFVNETYNKRLNNKMIKKFFPKYRCTQQELYSVARIGWRSCESHLTMFTSNKPLYTLLYVEAILAEIDAAQNLPDRQAREGVAELLRIQLLQALEASLHKARLLKSYILSAYPEEFIKTTLENAGFDYYTKATNKDWENAKALLLGNNKFIVTNEVDLSANNNMPSTFATDFLNSKDNFIGIYDQFIGAQEEAAVQAQAKVIANNNIFRKTRAMFDDGVLYTENDPALRSQFIFDRVLGLVSSPGPAGLKGVIMGVTTAQPQGLPQQDVTLSLYSTPNIAVDADYISTTEADGSYDFGNIASGDYTLKIELAGFAVRLEPVTILKGTTSSKDYTLTAA